MNHDQPTPPVHDEVLVSTMTALAAELVPSGAPTAPEVVVRFARRVVPHAEHAGLTMMRAGRPAITLAASDPVCGRVDRLQHDLGDGPCVDAAVGPPVVVTDDVSVDARWPTFGPRCTQATGVRSMLAVRLPVAGTDHAALNLYAKDAGVFRHDDTVTASLLAPFAALVVEAHLRREDVANLSAALETSRSIATAVGILMATHRVTRDDAFQLLRHASMDLNAKLRDVAAEVEHTGELPVRRGRRARPPGDDRS